jgi:hypothetical protein
MRKKNFLKAVSIFACLSILMLSVPGAIAAERPQRDFSFFKNIVNKIAYFLNLGANVEKGDTSTDTTSDNDSGQKIKITGGKLKAMLGSDD